MKKDLILNLTTGTLAVCALVVTGLTVRRELLSAPSPPQVRPVAEWRQFAAEGQRMGPADAPVVITEFSDFQCPYCRVLADRLKELRGRYPGQVAVVYRHFPLPSHAHAAQAARASECAAAQGRFEAYHDALYADQDSIGKVPWTRFAVAAQVPDTAAFSRCAAATSPLPVLARDRQAGDRLEVKGTPTFLLNSLRMQGVPPADTLDAFVRRVLAARAGGSVRVSTGAR
jgi:protein-disulfide isomerase